MLTAFHWLLILESERTEANTILLSCNTASKCHRQFETVPQVRTDFSQENFGTSDKLTEIFTYTSTIQVACDSLIQYDKC